MEFHDQGAAGRRRRHPRRSHQGAGVLADGRHHRLERAHRYRRRAVRRSGRRAHARWPRHRRRYEHEVLDAHARSGGPLRPRCAQNIRTSRISRRSNCPPTPSRPHAQSLKGQLAIGAARPGQGVDATSLQIPGVLDDLYSAKATPVTLGPSFKQGQTSLRVWAPTARNLTLRLFADSTAADFTSHPMTLDTASGVWTYTAPTASLSGKYYLYEAQVFVRCTNEVETNVVTDPYSVSLARNSTRSQIVSLADPDLQPRGWSKLHKPYLAAPEDIVLYELHVRDFSATDSTVPENLRGTYEAFTQKRSNGMKHLATLGLAGVTHVHLLPSFDFATINEDKSSWAVALVRHARRPASPTLPSSSRWSPRRRAAMASIGVMTRCTTTCLKAATPRTPMAQRACANSARWCSRSTRAACASSWTWSTTTPTPPDRTRTPSSTSSCPAITTGSTATASCSTRAAAPTRPPKTP